MGRVSGKVAVITGAGSGVGRACMKLFATEGARVVGASRTQSNLDETLAQVRSGGGEGVVIARDLSADRAAEELFELAVPTYGRVDILVHAAGAGSSRMGTQPR